jgi:hypothetical protein
MSTSITKRLEKLEGATGINDPCAVCDLQARFEARIEEFEKSIGIKSLRPRPCDLTYSPCSWCLRPRETNLSDYSISERALWEKWSAIHRDGLRCANAAVKAEVDAMCEATGRRKYGEHYDTYVAMLNEFTRGLHEIRGVPKQIYLCRVPECQCVYPKTLEQAHANLQKKLTAAGIYEHQQQA